MQRREKKYLVSDMQKQNYVATALWEWIFLFKNSSYLIKITKETPVSRDIPTPLETSFVPVIPAILHFLLNLFLMVLFYNKYLHPQTKSAQHCSLGLHSCSPDTLYSTVWLHHPLLTLSSADGNGLFLLVYHFQTFLHLFPGAHVSVYLGYILGAKLLCQGIPSSLAVVPDARLVFKRLHKFTLLHWHLNFGQPGRHEEAALRSLILHFPDYESWAYCTYILTILTVSCENAIHGFCPFSCWGICLFLINR